MNDETTSVISRFGNEITALRLGLNDLSSRLSTPQAIFLHASNIRERLTELGTVLERLNADLGELEKERNQLTGLFQVSRTVNSTLELEQVLNRTMDIVIQVTHAERGFLMLSNDRGELSFHVARNLEHSTITSPAFQVSRSVITHVAETGQAIITTDATVDPRFANQDSVINLNLHSILCTPLQARDHLIGVVYVDNGIRAGAFQAADLDAVRAFADQAAIAIENARLFESVRRQMHEIERLKTFQDNIFASIASGVVATDLADCITAFNRAAETIFVTSADEIMGCSYSDVLAPLQAMPLSKLVEEVKSMGKPVGTEIAFELPKRGAVNLSFNISSLKDTDGNSRGVAIVVDDVTEKRHLEGIREMFRRYVAPTVVDRLPNNPKLLKLGGQRQELTILFADIRGFTRFSEHLPPEELISILNGYLSIAANAIWKEEGTLDKFMGDAVMGIFNAPLAQEDHPLRAARAALAMRAGVLRLHKHLPKELRLHYGIGINTGEAVVGNVGMDLQMNFTAIGDAVNLAKRLQESAAGGRIILSGLTYERIHAHVTAKSIPAIRVKGREAITEVWELEGLSD